jgi:hypothetical protein
MQPRMTERLWRSEALQADALDTTSRPETGNFPAGPVAACLPSAWHITPASDQYSREGSIFSRQSSSSVARFSRISANVISGLVSSTSSTSSENASMPN